MRRCRSRRRGQRRRRSPGHRLFGVPARATGRGSPATRRYPPTPRWMRPPAPCSCRTPSPMARPVGHAWGGEFSSTAIQGARPQSRRRVLARRGGGWRARGCSVGGPCEGYKRTKPVHGNLWAKGHGKFTTKGNYGAAAVLGTKWLTRNLKRGTLFKVSRNHYDHNDRIRVTVDYPHRHTVVLKPGPERGRTGTDAQGRDRTEPRQQSSPRPWRSRSWA